jgi:PQQ-like domain
VAVIEVDREWTVAAQAAPPPNRRARFAALGLLVALLLGGAAAPAHPVPALASVPDSGRDMFEIVADTLYVAEPEPRDQSRVSAYRLPRGDRLWSTLLPVPVGVLYPEVAGGVLLGQAYRGPAGFAQVVALDTGTGRLLWRREGEVDWVRAASGQVLVGPGPGATRVRDLRLRTGEEVWSQAQWSGSAEAAASPPAGGADRVVLQSSRGGVQVLDADTGHVLADAAVPPGLGLYLVGDQVLVPLRQNGADVLAAYDLATLAPRWVVALPGPATFVADCGALLCVTGIGILTVLRSDDGANPWPAGSWTSANPVGRYLLADGPDPAVVDAGTGAVLLRLSGWSWLRASPDGGGRVLVRRPAREGPLVFAVLDASGAHPRLQLVGTPIGVRSTLCQAAYGYLACRTVDGRIGIWRYRV